MLARAGETGGPGGARVIQTVILAAHSGALHGLTVSFAAGDMVGSSMISALDFLAGLAATFDWIYESVRGHAYHC